MRRVLVESSYGSIWRELMEGITFYVRAKRAPWQIHCVTTGEIETGLERGVDGVLCLVPTFETGLVEVVKRSGVAAVNMLRDVTPGLPSVLSDHAAIGARAAEYYVGRGFKRFAFVGVERGWSETRYEGFARQLKAQGAKTERLHLPLSAVDLRALSKKAVLKGLGSELAKMGGPVAVFAAADFLSRAVVEACVMRKLRVPEDVAVLGVDDDAAICEFGPVTLSSIPQNLSRIGFEAARLLDGVMTGRRKSKRKLLVAPREVVVRRSTDLIAVANEEVAAVLRWIHNTDPRELSMKAAISEAGVSRQWLDRQFKEHLGRTPSEEIRRRRLQEARKLLLQTHLTVREIAMRCGFTHGENLTRFFNEWMHVSPSEYRKRLGSGL
jgi:LacI family transcriptional regulator